VNQTPEVYKPSDDEEDILDGTELVSDPKGLQSDTLRVPRSAPSITSGTTVDDPFPGLSLQSQALTHASHRILTEEYLAQKAEKIETKLVAIEEQLHNSGNRFQSGRMAITNLLNLVERQASRSIHSDISQCRPTHFANGPRRTVQNTLCWNTRSLRGDTQT
jgi:hypothetical protein